jgi:hypothetical protein
MRAQSERIEKGEDTGPLVSEKKKETDVKVATVATPSWPSRPR